MGMFDSIMVYMRCPYCGEHDTFEAQTKDLNNFMFTYSVLDSDWFSKKKGTLLGKEFRDKMPVFPESPEDKSAIVWENQGELIESRAKIPDEFKKLKYVGVTAGCNSVSCQFDADREWILIQGTPSGFGRNFRGKIKIKNGFLIGAIYDIERDKLKEEELQKYKVKYKKKFDTLMKLYGHEPIVCRYWGRIKT